MSAVHVSTVTVTLTSRCSRAYFAYSVFALFTLDLKSLEEGETSRPCKSSKQKSHALVSAPVAWVAVNTPLSVQPLFESDRYPRVHFIALPRQVYS